MEEQIITLRDIRNNKSLRDDYEVWDEKKKKWVEYKDSCYANDSSFPEPEKADYPINLITLYDSIEKKYYSFGIKPYTSKDKDVTYFYYPTETAMLKGFIEFWEKDPPDILSTWNGEGFDIPYIMNRLHNLFGEEDAARLSPVNSLYYRENVAMNKFGKMINRWYIRGISNIDYMEVYKTFSRGDRESYSLNYVGEYELKEGKIDTGGSNLAQLSVENWEKFVDYNIQDVRILVKLDEKLKFIKLVRTLSYKGFIPFEQAMGKVSMITGAVAHQAAIQGYVIPTFKNDGVRDEYVGGYVHEPERGLSKSVVSYDANSLYPNTIITLNISPETKIGKITTIEDKQYTIKLANEKTVTLSEDKFNKLVQKENLSISKYNVLYTQKFKGVIPNLIDRLYKERVEAKNEMIKREKSLSSIKDKKEKDKVEQEILNLDTQQNVYKLVLNSIYGVFAQKFSPLFDIDHSASITLTGQSVVKQAAEIVYEYALKKGCNVQKEKVYLYGDTDSFLGNTSITTNYGKFSVEDLFNLYKNDQTFIETYGHEIQPVKDKHIKTLTFDSKLKEVKWGNIKNLIRHKVSKKKYKIKVGGQEITMTEDHGCMVYRNKELIRVKPGEILKTDKMVIWKDK